MLLKDCPVGSVVRLVSICGYITSNPWWVNWSGEVFHDGVSSYVTDNDGTKWDSDTVGKSYQFEIVSAPSTRTLTLSGTTYALTPYEEPKLVTIDGVVYAMTEVV